jgi:hypothetical protein
LRGHVGRYRSLCWELWHGCTGQTVQPIFVEISCIYEVICLLWSICQIILTKGIVSFCRLCIIQFTDSQGYGKKKKKRKEKTVWSVEKFVQWNSSLASRASNQITAFAIVYYSVQFSEVWQRTFNNKRGDLYTGNLFMVAIFSTCFHVNLTFLPSSSISHRNSTWKLAWLRNSFCFSLCVCWSLWLDAPDVPATTW